MNLIETHIVSLLEKPIRLQEYAFGIFAIANTKSALKKSIKKGLIFVDKKPASTGLFIKGGEIISLFQSKENSSLKKLKLPLEVLFEDDYLAIIYKPAGILVSGNKFVTIANGLTQNLQKSTQKDMVYPQPVHRLDSVTSGVLLVGKTSSSILILNKLFENKKIEKTYVAVCIGKMKNQGVINSFIHKKFSETHFTVIKTVVSKRFEFLNLVKLYPKTGRKHQLRKHLLNINNPILGDKDFYTKKEYILNGKGLYLHAEKLSFIHPFTNKKLEISKDLPKKIFNIFPKK